MACNDSNIDLCYVKDIPALGDVSKVFAMNWRFFPVLDPQVNEAPHGLFICLQLNFYVVNYYFSGMMHIDLNI